MATNSVLPTIEEKCCMSTAKMELQVHLRVLALREKELDFEREWLQIKAPKEELQTNWLWEN